MEKNQIFAILLFILFHLSSAKRPISPQLVENKFVFPGLKLADDESREDLGHYAGSFKLPRAYDARLFYFFFESRNNKEEDPVIIWFNGGPGCSSSVAVFYENGPFFISDDLSLSSNDYGWDQVSNIIFIDQPIGTGFSYTNDERDIRHRDEEVIDDLYDFLQGFFEEHPQYANNELYLTGQSYAGHINSELAAKIVKENKIKQGIHINLKGFAMGNGLVNPAIQFKAQTDYALAMGMIQMNDYLRINKFLPACQMAIELCDPVETLSCAPSYWFCLRTIFYGVVDLVDNVNYHDIRKKCEEGVSCYDYSKMERFLNQEEVKTALGVNGLSFSTCNYTLDEAMLVDRMRNVEPIIPDLLEAGIKMLVYAGEHDFLFNWLGNWNWVHAMKWSDQKLFVASPNVSFIVDGAEAGSMKSYNALSFLKVYEAGNMVPMDQPKVALEMIKRWTQGTLSLDKSIYQA